MWVPAPWWRNAAPHSVASIVVATMLAVVSFAVWSCCACTAAVASAAVPATQGSTTAGPCKAVAARHTHALGAEVSKLVRKQGTHMRERSGRGNECACVQTAMVIPVV